MQLVDSIEPTASCEMEGKSVCDSLIAAGLMRPWWPSLVQA